MLVLGLFLGGLSRKSLICLDFHRNGDVDMVGVTGSIPVASTISSGTGARGNGDE